MLSHLKYLNKEIFVSIKFGTDGWRAVVGKEFTEENVDIVTDAIGKYVFETFGIDKKIIILTLIELPP